MKEAGSILNILYLCKNLRVENSSNYHARNYLLSTLSLTVYSCTPVLVQLHDDGLNLSYASALISTYMLHAYTCIHSCTCWKSQTLFDHKHCYHLKLCCTLLLCTILRKSCLCHSKEFFKYSKKKKVQFSDFSSQCDTHAYSHTHTHTWMRCF